MNSCSDVSELQSCISVWVDMTKRFDTHKIFALVACVLQHLVSSLSLPKFLTRYSPDSQHLLQNAPHFGLARTHDAYVLYRRAQGLEGLRVIDRLKGMRTIGLYGLLYAWRSLRAGNVVRAIGLIITNFWAIPLAIIELLRKSLKSFNSVK